MPAAFDLITQLKDGLMLRNVSTDVFGTVATLEGIRHGSKAQLNKAFSDRFVMPADSTQQLWALWCELESMINSLLPYRIDASDGVRLHTSLKVWRATGLSVLGLDESENKEEVHSEQ